MFCKEINDLKPMTPFYMIASGEVCNCSIYHSDGHYAEDCIYYGTEPDMGSHHPICLITNKLYPDKCNKQCLKYQERY